MVVNPLALNILKKKYEYVGMIDNIADTTERLIAVKALSKSFKCKVGAIIVIERTKQVIAFGYNLSPYGTMEVHSCCGKAADSNVVRRCHNCTSYYTLITLDTVIHAEEAAIAMLNFAPYTDESLKMYISRTPCEKCRKLLVDKRIDWEVVAC